MIPIKIRDAERRDCEQIAKLIMELAIHEERPEQAQLTAYDLEKDAFGASPPYFHCIVAEKEIGQQKIIVGYVLYIHSYSSFVGKMIYMEDLYVTPKHRFAGLGSKMLKHLAKICTEGGFARLKFECLEWNEDSIKFYKKHNAINMTKTDNWVSFRFEKDGLASLAKQNLNGNNNKLLGQ